MRLPLLSDAASAALAQTTVVLVRPQQPRNIGASARALKTMGLSRLALVAPLCYPDPQADQLAVSALDVLAAAPVHGTLDEALAGAARVFGISGRARNHRLPTVLPRQMASEVVAWAAQGPVHLLFGNEETGLDNAELARCQSQVVIPSAAACPSLNLAAAVQVICYELHLAALALTPGHGQRQGAGAALLQSFCAASDPWIDACGFYDNKDPAQVRARLRSLLDRARPDQAELKLLAGLLRQLGRGRRDLP